MHPMGGEGGMGSRGVVFSRRDATPRDGTPAGQGLLPFRFDATPRPMDLTAHADLTLIAETLLALGVDALVRDGLRLHARRRGCAEFDKLQAIVVVQAAGGDCVEDVRALARDAGCVRTDSRTESLSR